MIIASWHVYTYNDTGFAKSKRFYIHSRDPIFHNAFEYRITQAFGWLFPCCFLCCLTVKQVDKMENRVGYLVVNASCKGILMKTDITNLFYLLCHVKKMIKKCFEFMLKLSCFHVFHTRHKLVYVAQNPHE